ncbi:MAG: flagellar biosynthesis/type III secretory pathway protein, partial [Desulfobacterales bacterium]
MMSLSSMDTPDPVDGKNEGFKPMDIGRLDTFEAEVSTKTPETPPDYDRFKLLIDPLELEAGETAGFEALNTGGDDILDDPFAPLIKGAGVAQTSSAKEPVSSEAEAPNDAVERPAQKSPEEIGFEQGFEKGKAEGFEAGRAQGKAQGFEEGIAEGRIQGIEEGNAQGIEEGHQQGLAQGLEVAQAQVAAEAQEILTPLKESLETADQLLERMLARYEGQILELVQKIAQKVVGAIVDTDDEVVRYAIVDALNSLTAPEEITLNVSTEDYEYVEMVKDSFFEAVTSLKHIAVNSDPMISKGGCRIESAGAAISTDPESKL